LKLFIEVVFENPRLINYILCFCFLFIVVF